MTTALQIILLLVLIAIIGIILGYLFGKIGCKRTNNDKYIEHKNICEERYRDNLISNREEAMKEESKGGNSLDGAIDTFATEVNSNSEETKIERLKDEAFNEVDSQKVEEGKDLEDVDANLTEPQGLMSNAQEVKEGASLTISEDKNNSEDKTESESSDNQNLKESNIGASETSKGEDNIESEVEIKSNDIKVKEDSLKDEAKDLKNVEDNLTELQGLMSNAKEAKEDISSNDLENEKNSAKSEDSKSEDGDDNSKIEDSSSAEIDNSDSNEDINKDDSISSQDEDNIKKPVALSEPKGGKADNLCRIKGIGSVIEGKLHNLGIYHFEQIANWTEKEIAWVDKQLSFSGRIIREDWIGQAKLLAKGEETEFSKRVDKGEVKSSPSK